MACGSAMMEQLACAGSAPWHSEPNVDGIARDNRLQITNIKHREKMFSYRSTLCSRGGKPAEPLMSRRLAWTLLALLVLTLVVGTQIPGALRDGIERRMHAPSALSSWAHFAIFTAMAWVLSMRPLAWPAGRVLLAALMLALLTEGLQFFAVNRHPRLVDVGIDMAGTLLALTFVKWKESRAAFF